jgi:hypothetical protein
MKRVFISGASIAGPILLYWLLKADYDASNGNPRRYRRRVLIPGLRARAIAPNGSGSFITIAGDVSATPVSEWASLTLLGVGALGGFGVRRLRRHSDEA